MAWSEYIKGGEFLSRSFNHKIPMESVRVQRLSIYGSRQQAEFAFDFASFPPNLWDREKYNTLQASFVFLSPSNIKIDMWSYSQSDGYPYCDVSITKMDNVFRVVFSGDIIMEIICEGVWVQKLAPYLRSETPIL